MRTWALPLLALSLAANAAAQERSISPTAAPDHLKIPVELTKTIKAEKVRAGDEVRFQMAEPILAGKGLVIPANAKLFGYVLRASAAENGRHSHLSIVVERAEWKDHIVKLRAFIAGFGVKKQKQVTNGLDCISRTTQSNFRGRKQPLPQTTNSDAELDGCDTTEEQAALFRSNVNLISQIRMMRDDRDGHTVLISNKNIHLPGGILVILENREETALTAQK